MAALSEDKLKRAVGILEQCRDTLDWQVGTGNHTADFLYPKLKYALSLLEVEADGESESTTFDTYVERYPSTAVSTYDFTEDDD